MNRTEALNILKNVVAPVPEGETPNAEAFVFCIEIYTECVTGPELYEAIQTIVRDEP